MLTNCYNVRKIGKDLRLMHGCVCTIPVAWSILDPATVGMHLAGIRHISCYIRATLGRRGR